MIVPWLERAIVLNAGTSSRSLNTSGLDRLRNFFKSFFKERLKAADLRRRPIKENSSRLPPVDGLDRAHVLSLYLAVEVWRHLHGHDFISRSNRQALRRALSHPCNICYTCRHTNRVLHVRYDAELAKALRQCRRGDPGKQDQLSSGAAERARQVESVLRQLQRHPQPRALLDFYRNAQRAVGNVRQVGHRGPSWYRRLINR